MINSNKKIVTIALLSLSLSAGAALVPVLSDIAGAFPGREGWMQLLITLPALFMMFSSLFTDFLSQKSSMKAVTVASLVIILFAGVSPYFIHPFFYLLFSRALMGVGLGLLNTCAASLPALYFSDQPAMDKATGIQAAFVSAGVILFSLFSGTVAQHHWKDVFLIQLINILPLTVALFVMPDVNKTKESTSSFKGLWVKNAIPVVALCFITIIFTCTYPLNLSLFVQKSNLGTSRFVSLLTSINAGIGFFIGLVFGRVYSKAKEKTLIFALCAAAVALAIISLSQNQLLLLLGSILFGIGTSFISPCFYVILYKSVKPQEIVPAVALLGIGANVSQFVSPFVVNPVSKFIDGNSMEQTRLLLAAAVIFVLAAFAAFTKKKA